MHADDELKLMRRRLAGYSAEPPIIRSDGGSAVYLGRTYSGGAYPTVVPAVYVTRPVVYANANEAEGASDASAIDGSNSVPVLVLGSKVPAIGSDLIGRRVGGLWIADSVGAGTSPENPPVSIPDCFACTTSYTVLDMLSHYPSSWNPSFFPSDTLRFEEPRAGYPLPPNAWTGDTEFIDDGGNTYRPMFSCAGSSFVYTRLYSVGPDSSRYSWSIGSGGNTCVPFYLANGTVFPGGLQAQIEIKVHGA